MAVVNTNTAASISQAALARNERLLSKAMEQLSTGQKINTAADNAAGLAISTRMTSQIRGLEQSIQNAHDAISMVNTAEGAMNEITNMLQRMRELALQASNGTTSAEDRQYLDKEYKNLIAEIDRIAENTEWNGRPILSGRANGAGTDAYWPASGVKQDNTVSFQVGMDAGATISVDFGDFRGGEQARASADTSGYKSMSATIADLHTSAAAASESNVTRSGVFGQFSQVKVYYTEGGTSGLIDENGGTYVLVNGAATTIAADTTASAQIIASAVMTHIDSALTAVSEQRSTFGAVTNQLTYAIDNLTNVSTNSQASRSRMMDTDYAKATSELAKAQIIQQAGTAMLAQANQLPASVLDLIK